MLDMNRWTFCASLFFSISLCGSAYDAVQGTVTLAGAGNPQALERTLSGFVGRMGGSAVAEIPAAPAPTPVVFNAGANDQELSKLADFVVANGKEKVLHAGISEGLGYQSPANIKQKAWQTPDEMRHFCQYNTDNNTDIILTEQTADGVGYVWLTDRSGKLRMTLKTGGGQNIKVPNSEADAKFKTEKAYFLGKVPATQVAAGEPGTN